MRKFKVRHSKFGSGIILDTRFRGQECLVEFKTGLRMWVSRDELQLFPYLRPISIKKQSPAEFPEITPLKPIGNQGREVIEAFRMGIVPQTWVKEWTVGRSHEIATIKTWLHDQTSGTLVIKGGYGSGKSHLLDYLYGYALELNYAVAKVGIDPVSTHMAFPKRVYRSLVQSMKIPYNGRILDFREGLVSLAQAGVLTDHGILAPFLKALKKGEVVPSMWYWIEGLETSFTKWGVLYDHTTAANIYCYILSGISHALADVLDLNGLILLFDEAESARIYRYTYEWLRGINFFKALVLTANDEPDLVEERIVKTESCYRGECSGLIYSGHRRFPYVYKLPSYLKVVFAVTPDVSLEKLTSEYNIYTLELGPLNPEILEHFFYRFVELYRKVYGLKISLSEKKEIFGLIKRYALFSTRLFIKAMVECLDFKRFYPQKTLKNLGSYF